MKNYLISIIFSDSLHIKQNQISWATITTTTQTHPDTYSLSPIFIIFSTINKNYSYQIFNY
jgi:hypothetical protein